MKMKDKVKQQFRRKGRVLGRQEGMKYNVCVKVLMYNRKRDRSL